MPRSQLNFRRSRGFLLIAAVVVLVAIAIAIAALGNMTAADVSAGARHAQSSQAYFSAISGLEVATREYTNGTACASLSFPGGAIPSTTVGVGSFSTTGTLYPTAFTATLQANIPANNAVPMIPISFSVGSLSSLAPRGEISIDSESITYGGASSVAATCSPVAAPCLIGVMRATNGSTIAGHTAGAAISQAPQCVIRSVGAVASATRVVENTVIFNSTASNLYSGASMAMTTGVTASLTGGAWSPGLPAGDNYVLAIVNFSDATAGLSSVPNGNLRIIAANPTANPLAQNYSTATWGNGNVPSTTVFPQETQVLLAKHTGAQANASYDLQVVNPTSSNSFARAQILVISGIPAANASFVSSGGNLAVGVGTAAALATSANTLPAGGNIIIAAVNLDNTANGNRLLIAGNLAIRRGAAVTGTVLMSNRYDINMIRNNRANEGTGYLLLAHDPGAAAGTRYVLTGQADNNGVNASAAILVFNGFSAKVQPLITAQPPVSTNFGATATTLGSVADGLASGERVVIAGIQYYDTVTTRTIATPNETLTLNGTAVSSPASTNPYNWTLCTGTAGCDDYFTGLMWRGSSVSASPTFGVRTQADGATVAGAANILSIRLAGASGAVRQIVSAEIVP